MTTIIPLTRRTRVQKKKKKIYLCSNQTSIPLSGGSTVFKAWENWGVTIPGFLRESDIMRYLCDKSMWVRVLRTISEGKKKKEAEK